MSGGRGIGRTFLKGKKEKGMGLVACDVCFGGFWEGEGIGEDWREVMVGGEMGGERGGVDWREAKW